MTNVKPQPIITFKGYPAGTFHLSILELTRHGYKSASAGEGVTSLTIGKKGNELFVGEPVEVVQSQIDHVLKVNAGPHAASARVRVMQGAIRRAHTAKQAQSA